MVEGSFRPCGMRYNARRMGPVSQRTLEGVLGWSLGLHRKVRMRWEKSQGGEGLFCVAGSLAWLGGGDRDEGAPLELPLVLLRTHKNQKNCRIFNGIFSPPSFGFIPFAIRNLLNGGWFWRRPPQNTIDSHSETLCIKQIPLPIKDRLPLRGKVCPVL